MEAGGKLHGRPPWGAGFPGVELPRSIPNPRRSPQGMPIRSREMCETGTKVTSDLLALKLGYDPRSEDARAAVRAYLQEKLDEKNDPGWTSVSQWLREEALLDLVDKRLSGKYWRWFEAWVDAADGKKRR